MQHRMKKFEKSQAESIVVSALTAASAKQQHDWNSLEIIPWLLVLEQV